MSVVAADFVDKAHLPALRDHFPAPIAVAHNLTRAAKNKKHRASAWLRGLGLSATGEDIADDSDV
jgi:hypothetical protein